MNSLDCLEIEVPPRLISRRNFLKISAVTVAGCATGQIHHVLINSSPYPSFRGLPINERLLSHQCDLDNINPALTRRYPWLAYGDQISRKIQIANIHNVPLGARPVEFLGERIFTYGDTRFLPWTPMFKRPTLIVEANDELKALTGADQLYIKDEGSESAAIYGNKIRKYEFLLPSLALSGVRKVFTHGAFGSNHCAHLALAARYGAYRPVSGAREMETEFMLYPQEMTENTVTKLKLLVASGSRLHFLENDAAVALSIVKTRLQARFTAAEAYIEPGGSSPLAVLGHVEALMELAEQIEVGTCSLTTPPDYIFVPLGSGATAIGLVLGCYLLGWPTKVIGTCSQDKGLISRVLVNGDASAPFLVANAASLLDKALAWLAAMGLSWDSDQARSSEEILKQGFAYDNVTWRPGYGQVTPKIQREATKAGKAGLVLDNTFTAKSFHTLRTYQKAGLLKNKSALFWNTYQRFPLHDLLPADPHWTMALSEPIQARVEAFLEAKARLSKEG